MIETSFALTVRNNFCPTPHSGMQVIALLD
jgi:hypothetical protein